MNELFVSGRVADLVLVVLAIEFVVLGVRASRLGDVGELWRWYPGLAAGASLVLALRGALTDAPIMVTSAWLAAGGVAHAIDMIVRRRRG